MKHISWAVGIIRALLIAGMIAGSASAAAVSATDAPVARARQVTLKPFQQDEKLTMPRNAISSWFSVPSGVALSGSGTIELHMSHSRTLLQERSTITVYLNDQILATRATVEPGRTEWTWTVEFDPSLIRVDGFNELKVTSMQRSIEGECADIDNPSNWAIVHGDSRISMRCDMPLEVNLSEYNNLFYDSFNDPTEMAADFVLADPADGAQVSAMMRTANAAGARYRDKRGVDFAVANEASSRHAIVISDDTVPADPSAMLGRPLGAGEGYLSLRAYDAATPYYRLFLSGDEAGLHKAVSLLGNGEILGQVHAPDMALTSDVPLGGDEASVPWNESGMYALSSFGYDDIVLSDVFHQRTELVVRQPEGRRGTAGSYLDLHFRHSVQLLPDRSQITVSIGGKPIHSAKLTPGNAQEGTLRVDIPEEALRDAELRLTVEVYHDLGKVDCSKEYTDVAWTVIDADDSKLYLPGDRTVVRASLAGFPYFDPGSGGETVSVYAPDAVDEDVLPVLPLLAARVGQNTGANFLWNVGDAMPEKDEGDMLILAKIGGKPLPTAIADALSVVPDGNGYAVRDDAQVIAETLRGRLILQAIRSPWNEYRRAYVALYEGKDELEALAALLRDRDALDALDGTISLVGADGTVNVVESASRKGDDTVAMGFVDYVKVAEAKTGMAWWVIVLLVAGNVVGITAIVRLARHKRDEYREAGRKHKAEQTIDGEVPETQEGLVADDGANTEVKVEHDDTSAAL